jgi:hypothetical protein
MYLDSGHRRLLGVHLSCGVFSIMPRDPTLSDRISRSQSIRCASVRLVVWWILLESMMSPCGRTMDQPDGVGNGAGRPRPLTVMPGLPGDSLPDPDPLRKTSPVIRKE